jgi:signal transduction histidine kinase
LRRLYLCTSDTTIDNIVISALGFDQLLSIIREQIVGSICIILDCCHSGAVKESFLKGDVDLLDPPTESFENSEGLTILTSTSAVDSSIANKLDRNSIFTHKFIMICNELLTKKDSYISTLDIYASLDKTGKDNMYPSLLGDNLKYNIFKGTKSWVLGIQDNNIESAIRIFHHESSQILTGLESLWERNFSSLENVKQLITNNRFQQVNNDFNALLSSLRFVMDNSRLTLSGRLNTNFSIVNLQEKILKCTHNFNRQIQYKNVNLDILTSEHIQIFTDPHYLDILLYNLVSNSINYCSRGTIIYLDYTLNEKEKYISINIKNYGDGISPDEDIFSLYKRGDNAINNYGLGIGLYVSKKIVQEIKGKINVSSILVSNYNIAVMPNFLQWLNRQESKEKDDKIELIKGEYQQLLEYGIIDKVIAKRKNGNYLFEPGYHTMQLEIYKPTFEVTFTIRIPV